MRLGLASITSHTALVKNGGAMSQLHALQAALRALP